MPDAVYDLIDQILTDAARLQLTALQVRAVADRAFERGLFIRSMEAFEIVSPTRQPLRVDLSILGLDEDWDARASGDEAYARKIVAEKPALAAACPNTTLFEVWLDEQVPPR
ncbi:hypothetical protein GVY41_18665 [Frigidibacter albus]|uniref:Uncharacterized protein n=1 Tax=Frigidibacter albus TaxID=1465486 RepID=A0A6L8VMW3_9RHOB|nr:hypothetical protein [Frigidibacter albus]MZQ90719.1 hypothetical protein [Frigidibacter albus]NBE33026.1 hypothetical protein [Frigidibacter albus]GGH60082.1 hypothetical protein GCM10011341_31980 [Frigidibacter albus]